MRLRGAFLAVVLSLSPALVFAQGIQPAGARFTPGHTLRALNSQGTAVGDAGGAAGSSLPGQGYLTELGITNTGDPLCINDALTNAPSGYHWICFGANSNSGASIISGAAGGAATLPLNIGGSGPTNLISNGVVYPVPQTDTSSTHVPTQAALASYSIAATTLIRDGFTAAGDTPPLSYVLKSGACSAPDNGAQVPFAGGGMCWTAQFPTGMADPRWWGGVCSTSVDSTAGIQAAINASTAVGSWVAIPCPMMVAGTLTLKGSVRLTGMAPAYYPGQQDIPNPAIWPPLSGPAIDCASASGACVHVIGTGVEIDHINFGNPQPPPPSSGTWTPTFFPFVISTDANSGWQGLYLHDLTCTACSQFIDLEGTSNYAAYSGSQIRVQNIWCNACLNVGMRMHLIDNPLEVSHFEFTPSYYFNVASMGAYQRANLIGFDMQYVAAAAFDNIEFFSTKSAIQVENGTVTNNFGMLTFATTATMMTNIKFNQVCQAITAPGGNGTIAEFLITNGYFWGDQSGFNCSAGKALVQMDSNDIRFNLTQGAVAYADTFLDVGCGVPGVGSCPGGGPGGGAIVRLNQIDVFEYSHFTAGQPFYKAPSGTFLSISGQDLSAIRPSASAGNIGAPGLDGSQGYMQGNGVGGGSKSIEGATIIEGGDGNPGCCSSPPSSFPGHTGQASFYMTNNSRAGYVGRCSAFGCDVGSDWASVFLKPNDQISGSGFVSIGSAGSTVGVTAILPTTCNGTTASSTIVGTVLTAGTPSGIQILPGDAVTGSGVTAGTHIVSLGTGRGGAGTYNVDTSQTVASTTLTYTHGTGTFLNNAGVMNICP